MRRFLRLLYKEWRDHRALILVWACLAPILSQVAQWAFLDHHGDVLVGRYLLPGLGFFFQALLAAELVGREAETGTGDSLGRLPLRQGMLLLAKLVFLVLAGVVLMTWVLAAEAAWRTAVDRPLRVVFDSFRAGIWLQTTLATGTLIVFACAVLMRRSFPAALLGVGLTLGLLFGLRSATGTENGSLVVAGLAAWHPYWWPAVIGGACLLASWLAYRPWRSRSGDGFRRTWLCAAGMSLVLAPAGVAAVRRYRAELTLAFHGAGIRIDGFAPSPDARQVALLVSKAFSSTHWWGGGRLQETWVLDLADESLLRGPRTESWYGGLWWEVWTPMGELLLRDNWSSTDDNCLRWNPSTGLRSRSATPDFDGGHRGARQAWWTTTRDESGYRITWPESGLEMVVPAVRWPAYSPEPGIAFYLDGQGRLMRASLAEGVTRELADGCDHPDFAQVRVSPDGRRIYLWDVQGSDLRYLDAETGAALAERSSGRTPLMWTGIEEPWAVCMESGVTPKEDVGFRFFLLGDGEIRSFDWDNWRFRMLSRDRILVLDGDRKRLLLVDDEGNTLRTLYEPED